MKIPPFTLQEATDLAALHKGLVGREYLDPDTKRVYQILTVGVLPFFPYDRCCITHLYMGLIRKLEGITVEQVLNFIVDNSIREFDVVLTARPTEDDEERLLVRSIDVFSVDDGLAYDFKITLL